MTYCHPGYTESEIYSIVKVDPTLLDDAIRLNPAILYDLEVNDELSFYTLIEGSQVARDAYRKKLEAEEQAIAEKIARESIYYPELNIPDLSITSVPNIPARDWQSNVNQPTEVAQALDLLNAQYGQSLGQAMQQALNDMSLELQDAAMDASMVRAGIDLTLKVLPVATWVGQAINSVLDAVGSRYKSEATEILENARRQALAKKAASDVRVKQKFSAVLAREKPYALAIAMHDLGLPVAKPPSELDGIFSDIWDAIKDFGHNIEKSFIRPIAQSVRSYVGGRIIKEKAQEEAANILRKVDEQTARHEQNIDKITSSIGFRLSVREELANIAKNSPEVKAIANQYHQAVQYVKNVVSSQIKQQQREASKQQFTQGAKKLGVPLAIGGAVILASMLLD